jgi:hypothetical protein
MQRLGVYLCYASVWSCLLTGVSAAQSAATATIVGKVVDPQGAVILDAKVTAVNTTTGVSRSVNTTSSGDYAIPSLPPGTYDIKAQASGFALAEAKEIKLNVGDQQDLNFKLVIAGASETVEATVEAPLIETTKTDVSTSVTDVDMRRLPTLNGASGIANDYAELALLVSATKRLSHHVEFVTSYTWSHALTSGEDLFGLSEPGHPRNTRAELGPAFNDIRHAGNFNLLLDSGKFTDRSAGRWFANDLTLGFLG